jgi:ribose-phosphate pyrophosphokinase
LKFDKVFIIDPHSKEATKLIKNSIALYPKSSIEETLFKNNIDLIVYPDKGALEKYTKAYDHLNVPFIYGEKVRDQLTGKITHYEVVGDPQDKSILICDDICDGGATFIILTKELLRLGAKKVFLFVSHGLFSNGTQILFENGIQKIITADGEVQ